MRLLLSLLAVLLIIPFGYAQTRPDSSSVRAITPKALSELLGHVHVIDVNEDFTYAEAHVPGAKFLAYDAISAEMLPADKSSMLVFYCWSPECPAAGMAALSAIRIGFTQVYCMAAGITGWQDAGLPTEP